MKNLQLLTVCNYPSDTRPSHQAFLATFLQSLSSIGVDITVLAPQTIWNRTKKSSKFRLAQSFEKQNGISIYRPTYISYSNIPLPFNGTTDRWSFHAHARATLKSARELPGPFDICLAHFLYPHGYAATGISDLYHIPVVISLGESSFRRYEKTFSKEKISQHLSRFAAIITNSEPLRRTCIERFHISENMIHVFPNGINNKHFYPRDRLAARQSCNLPPDRTIIISVGQFIDRKGPLRIMEAIKSRPEIGAVFLGNGPQEPSGEQVLFKGMVRPEEIPLWLSAADIFVLPTLAEGCSNAILEALACGLPVISSDLPFNHEILDDNSAYLIDPLDITALGESIDELSKNKAKREKMSRAALEKSRLYQIEERSKKILALLYSLSSFAD